MFSNKWAISEFHRWGDISEYWWKQNAEWWYQSSSAFGHQRKHLAKSSWCARFCRKHNTRSKGLIRLFPSPVLFSCLVHLSHSPVYLDKFSITKSNPDSMQQSMILVPMPESLRAQPCNIAITVVLIKDWGEFMSATVSISFSFAKWRLEKVY